MNDHNFYSLFGYDELLDRRVEYILKWYPHTMREQELDRAADTLITNRLISSILYPQTGDANSAEGANNVMFVLTTNAFNESIEDETLWEDAINNSALFQYKSAYANGRNEALLLASCPSIQSIEKAFGKQPQTTGEPSFIFPEYWNAYMLLSAVVFKFYQSQEFDRSQITKNMPGWGEASLQNLSVQTEIAKRLHPKRKTAARACGDAAKYFPLISFIWGMITVLRAYRYKSWSLERCANEMEIRPSLVQGHLPEILIYTAWFEKQLLKIFTSPYVRVPSGKFDNSFELKRSSSQTITKLVKNNGYVCLMPLNDVMSFDIPDGCLVPWNTFKKDFAFLWQQNLVKTGSRSSKSR